MRTHFVVVAALAAGAVTALPPGAQAAEPVYHCNYEYAQRDGGTGTTYEGAAWGYVVHATGPAQIRCYLKVNGAEAAGTDLPVVLGGAGLTFGRLTFDATDTDVVDRCAEVTTPHGTFHRCFEPVRDTFPPQATFDLLDRAVAATDLCTWTRFIGSRGFNVLGQVVITASGDVYVAGDKSMDCS